MPTLGPESAYIFRITHVNNVAWMLRHGMHCGSSPTKDPNFVSIGSPELIEKRRTRRVPIAPRGTLSDYVPFYFTPWSKMFYNIKTGYGVPKRPNHEIAILVSSLRILWRLNVPFIYTNYHAYMAQEDEFFDSLENLEMINWDLLRSRDFRNDPENPRKSGEYQAEALVHRCVPVEAIVGIVCYNSEVKASLIASAEETGVQTSIRIVPYWYF